MKKRLLLFLVVLMGLTSAMAADEITCSNFYISRGETKTFAIQLTNEATNYVGFQMDLTLPEGLTLNKTGCSLSARITDENQELTIGKQGENVYRFTSTSFSLTPISGASGELITVSVTASDTYQGGNATISNIQFATSESERVTMNDVAFNIHLPIISFADENVKAICVANWDTNGDGELDQSEAAAAGNFGKVFYNNKDITSFDEFQYFTGLAFIWAESFSGCSGLTSITIPNSVREIYNYAFSGCSGLTSITIPNGVKYIADGAFDGCYNLISITIPESVTRIGQSAFNGTAWYNNLPDGLIYIGKLAYKYKGTMPENTSIAIEQGTVSISSFAFSGCSGLTSITIPNSVTDIGDGAFRECSGLTSITIPESVTYIGIQSFSNCSGLTSVNIPNSVTSIGEGAFQSCSGLTSIMVESGNTVYDSRDNCNAIIKKSTNALIAGCQNTVIPNSVKTIGNKAFLNLSGLTSIEIPNSVTTIDNHAFRGCSGLTSIKVDGENAIYDSRGNCNAIIEKSTNTLIVGCMNTIIPEGVTTIGESAFQSSSGLTSIIIPESVTSIGSSAFSGCPSLTAVIIGSSVTTIGGYAFSDCSSLTSIVIPNSVTSIGSFAFKNCSSLISITIGSSVTSIEAGGFMGCSGLTSITIPESVTYIGGGNWLQGLGGAFENCSGLTSITIGNSVTSIGIRAFYGCSSLTSINIPESVTSIGGAAFRGCSDLASVIVNNCSPLTISESTFENCSNTTLYVPKNCKAAYAAADVWKYFKAIKEFPDPDVNQDGYVDVVDVVDVARFVVGTPSESFKQFLADLNGSGEVNVADAVVLVNEIACDVNWSRPMHAPAISDGILTLTKNTDHSLSFSLKDDSAYTAFQFDLTIPEGMDVTQMTLNSSRKQNHQLLYNKISDGHYRVVALSTSNQSFNGTAGELLSMALDDQPADDTMIDNIHFVTAQGKDLQFDAIGISGDTPTGISDASRLNDNGERRNGNIVYNLNGQRLTKAQKGLYIIHGKKVVVK